VCVSCGRDGSLRESYHVSGQQEEQRRIMRLALEAAGDQTGFALVGSELAGQFGPPHPRVAYMQFEAKLWFCV
jgi:hypothetical protein